jgi:hypothetical protein
MVVLTDPEYMVIIGKIPQYRRIVAYISKCGYLDILVVAGIIRHMYAKQAAAIATNILVEDVIHGDTIDIYIVQHFKWHFKKVRIVIWRLLHDLGFFQIP